VTFTTGKDAFIDVLRSEGVEYVFGIPGATEIQFMDAFDKAPDINYMLGLHEVVCAGMAEGYARATGRPGLLNLHTATGVAAASPLLYNAHTGRVPMVVTAGQNDTRLLQRDPQLTGDIVGIGRIHGKWSTELVHAADIPTAIHRAFKLALQPPMGPVLVSIPQNVLTQEFDYRPTGATRLFGRPRPETGAVARAVEIIREAKRPLLLVDSGVTRCDALAEVVRLAELSGARVQQVWMADVNFPVSHPQYLGDLDLLSPRGRDILAQADVLIAVGCPLFAEGFLDAQPVLAETAKVIHVDDDPWELGKNVPTDCAILGDVRAVLIDLNAALEASFSGEDRAGAAARAAELRVEKTAAQAALRSQAESERDCSPVAITRLMAEIARVSGPDTLIVDECWSASPILRQTLDLTRPRSFFRSRQGGSIGSGLPSALGVKLGLPQQDVLAVVGDGSAAWSMQSLWTAARYGIPVTYVITNNATYRQVKLVRRAVLGDYPLDEKHEGMEIDRPLIDFSALAGSMGVAGERVANPDDLNRALTEAMASGEPRVVEVMTECPA
jgi:benzoylformate decarboxylase